MNDNYVPKNKRSLNAPYGFIRQALVAVYGYRNDKNYIPSKNDMRKFRIATHEFRLATKSMDDVLLEMEARYKRK